MNGTQHNISQLDECIMFDKSSIFAELELRNNLAVIHTTHVSSPIRSASRSVLTAL